MSEILDSGDRTEFESGAVRDMKEGKGRFDLMPLMEVANYALYEGDMHTHFIFAHMQMFVDTGDASHLNHVLDVFCNKRGWSLPEAMLEVSKHFEQGALKYGENNWKKGIPENSYIDSALRHYLKWKRGDDDEPHDRAFVWNILCLAWTVKNISKKS